MAAPRNQPIDAEETIRRVIEQRETMKKILPSKKKKKPGKKFRRYEGDWFK